MNRKGIAVALGLLYLLFAPVLAAEVTKTVNAETGLLGWKLREGNFEMELVQRLPDQTRAFFQARGFPATIADRIARACVMQTIVRNTGQPGRAQAVRVDLREWRLKYRNLIRPIKRKETWLAEWTENAISPAARIAFRWATFPTGQIFEPRGDYNWGMTSYGLPPGVEFDLQVVWHEGPQRHVAWLRHLQCAADRRQ